MLILHPPHSATPHPFCSDPPPLLLLLPSLTQGPYVPVCNISKAVRQLGQGKQPSTGSGVMEAEMFSSGTQGPPKASGWGQGWAEGGRRSPQLPPRRTYIRQSLFLLPFVSFLHTLLFLWLLHFLHLCTHISILYT